MKQITSIPSHYRQLAPNEVIRKGDLFCYRNKYGQMVYGHATTSIGYTSEKRNKYFSFPHTYYRRQHVKVKAEKKVDMINYPSKSPLVCFDYPCKPKIDLTGPVPFPSHEQRFIRLIAANDKYVVGLDINDGFKYKKFLHSKVKNFILMEFNTSALK